MKQKKGECSHAAFLRVRGRFAAHHPANWIQGGLKMRHRTWAFLLLLLAPTSALAQVGFTRTFYPTGSRPVKVITADFNGDGKADLATANFNGNSVSVLLGNGNGTFQTQVSFPSGTGPRSLAAADLNNDGKLDLVTANEVAGTVSVLLGSGTGAFQAKVDFAAGAGTRSITTGDFNSDGKLDVVTANSSANSLSILLGNGAGSLTAQTPLSTSMPAFVTAADLDGDAKLDLVVAPQPGGSVSVFLSTGPATFGPAVTISGPVSTGTAHVADVSADGKPDLTIPDAATAALQVLLGSGAGTFSAGSLLGTDTEPRALTSTDLDNDGHVDLAAATAGYFYYYYYYAYLYSAVTVFRGTGGGAFANRTDFSLGWSHSLRDVVTADFNGDNKPDLAVIEDFSDNVNVLLQSAFLRPSPSFIQFSPNQAVGTTSAPQTITVASTGSFPAVISGVSISGTHAGNFTKASDNCSGTTVPLGSSCTIAVAFAPTARGSRDAFLQIASNGTASPDLIGLYGVGAGAGVLTPAATSVSFGDQSIFTSSAGKTLTLTNTGTDTLAFFSFNLSGPFTAGHSCPNLAPGTSCTVNLVFNPDALGALSGSLVISSDTVASPTTIALSGNGVSPPSVSLPVTSLDFSTQQLGVPSTAQVVTVTAVGTGTLAVAIGISGNFTQTNTCGSSIAGGTNCTISVRFVPTAIGAQSGTLVISTNAPGSPHVVTLTGAGTDFAVSPGASTASVAAGQSASFQITLTGAGGFSGNVALACAVTRSFGLPEPTITCTTSPATAMVSGTTPVPVIINVRTTARSLLLLPPQHRIPPLYFLLLAFGLWAMRSALARHLQLQWSGRALNAAVLLVVLAGALAACGGSHQESSGTAAGNYTVTVTANSGAATRTILLSLSVQ